MEATSKIIWKDVAGFRLPIIEEAGAQWLPCKPLAKALGIKLSRLKAACLRMSHCPEVQLRGEHDEQQLRRNGLTAILLGMRQDDLTRGLQAAAIKLGAGVTGLTGRPRMILIDDEVKEALAAGHSKRSVAKQYKIARATVARLQNRA